MTKYTRKYYINNVETSLDTVLKYLEIMLTHGVDYIGTLGISFKDVISDMDKQCINSVITHIIGYYIQTYV